MNQLTDDNRQFLIAILNSGSDDPELQVIAYNVLNIPSYHLTPEESAILVAARLRAAA